MTGLVRGFARELRRGLRQGLPLAAVVVTAGCELGPKESVQVGYRGVGQEVNYDRSTLAAVVAANVAPPPLAPAAPSAAVARWQNVQVLTDVSPNEFNRTMLAMTQWVSPVQGCGYCHNAANFASDELYPKVVARRMLQMTRQINSEWKPHVQNVGVTCYSCHRGQPVPQAGLWFHTDREQYLRAYLDRRDARVQSLTVGHTSANRSSIKQAENTYALMINMSQALGVNCTACHNSRSWSTWQNAPPARITAQYGLRMVRDINSNYLVPLAAALPANRRGPHGDAPKIACITCHQGLYKPLGGAEMAQHYPALWGSPTWTRGGASDTGSVGFRDLRGRDSLPTDAAPRLLPQAAVPAPPPNGRTPAAVPALPPTGRTPATSPDTVRGGG